MSDAPTGARGNDPIAIEPADPATATLDPADSALEPADPTDPTGPTEDEVLDPAWRARTALFLTGQTVSLLGSMLVQYAVMWHLTLTTQSGTVMAMMAVFGFLPQAVISIFGGVWADRHNRKWLIMGADAMIALTTLGLALAMLAGTEDLWLIYIALAIRSAGAGIQTPAVSALLPQIVPTSKLLRVNGINGSIQSGMALLAPAAAAAIYASLDIVAVFFVDVVTAAIGIGLLALLPVPRLLRTDGGERPSYFTDLTEGVRYITNHRFIRWLLGLWAVVFVLAVAPSFLTPLMVVRTFGAEVWKLTATEIAFSIGMMAGGAVIAVWGQRWNRLTLIIGACLTFGLLSIGLGLSPNLWIFLGFMLLVGLAVPAFATPSMTLLQETVEPERQGRVFGFVGIVMAVAMPFGMAIFGPLADVISVQALLIIAGVATFGVVAFSLTVPTGRKALAEARGKREDS